MPKFDNEDALYALSITENMEGLVVEGNNHKVGRLLSLHGFLRQALNENERLEGKNKELDGALKNVQSLISEGAKEGFNCHKGDWAERLFHSQQRTSKALDA